MDYDSKVSCFASHLNAKKTRNMKRKNVRNEIESNAVFAICHQKSDNSF